VHQIIEGEISEWPGKKDASNIHQDIDGSERTYCRADCGNCSFPNGNITIDENQPF
jgi:hypothetical protein